MKSNKITQFVLFLVTLHATAIDGRCQDSVTLELPRMKDEFWWMGIINHGNLMPLTDGYSANLSDNLYGNQAQPLLLSNKGNVVWSEDAFKITCQKNLIVLKKANGAFKSVNGGNNLKEGFLYASRNFFPPSGLMPDGSLFLHPQYNTWIELLYNQNQQDVLKYATAIKQNGFPAGVIMIDDNWQEGYGTWKFHPGRFPDTVAMMDSLHAMGFKVMVWICPFVSADTETFRKLQLQNALVTEKDGYPKLVRWWNGSSAVLDLTDPNAATWFNEQLEYLMKINKIDGFKFDAGDPEYYTDGNADQPVSSNVQTELFARTGLRFPLNEFRATWKMGGQPLAQRLRDKGHTWGDLQTLIPDILLQGIMGYPFTCPDMIGGGEMGSFMNLQSINQDLVVRSAQLHALMPMMQFSAAPWRILDSAHLVAVKSAVDLRLKYTPLIIKLAEEAAKSGVPVVRMMEYEFPGQGFEKVNDQFMLGDKLLVAPILNDRNARIVKFPKGKWRNVLTNEVIKGPKAVSIVNVPIQELPFFLKLD